MSAPPITERHRHHFHRQSPIKESVRAATTANVTISTALNNGDTLDGVTLATGDRVLVKDQSTASQNGIYVVGATPVRDYDVSTDDPAFGFLVYVREGSTNAATLWKNTNTSAPTVGTTSLTFSQFTGSALTDHTHAATGSGSNGGGSTLTPGTLNLPTATSPAQTSDGQAVWDSDDDVLTIGDGSSRKTFGYLGSTTPSTDSGSGAAGSSKETSRADHVHPAGAGSGTLTTIEEVDGSPTDSAVTKLVFPNGTLSIVSHVATYTPAGGGGGGTTKVVLGLPTGSLSRSYTFDSTVESWTASAGSITASGGKAVLTHTSNTVGLEPSGAGNVADGECEMEFVIAGGVEASLVFRATDASNFYMFTLDDVGQTAAMYKCVAGTFTALVSTTGQWFWSSGTRGAMLRMMVRFNGSDLSGYLNGTLVFHIKDTTLTTGRVGARTFNGTLNIDNVHVYSSPDLYTGNVSAP